MCLCGGIYSSRKEIVVLKDMRHCPHYDIPEEFAKVLKRILGDRENVGVVE